MSGPDRRRFLSQLPGGAAVTGATAAALRQAIGPEAVAERVRAVEALVAHA